MVLEGELEKKGQKGPVKMFRTRWFRLKEGTLELHYYRHKDDTKSKGFINIGDVVEVCRTTNESGKYGFDVKTQNRVYILQASSDRERYKWIKGFQSLKHDLMVDGKKPTRSAGIRGFGRKKDKKEKIRDKTEKKATKSQNKITKDLEKEKSKYADKMQKKAAKKVDKEKKEARKLGIDLDQETARGIDQYMHSTADEKVRKKDAKLQEKYDKKLLKKEYKLDKKAEKKEAKVVKKEEKLEAKTEKKRRKYAAFLNRGKEIGHEPSRSKRRSRSIGC